MKNDTSRGANLRRPRSFALLLSFASAAYGCSDDGATDGSSSGAGGFSDDGSPGAGGTQVGTGGMQASSGGAIGAGGALTSGGTSSGGADSGGSPASGGADDGSTGGTDANSGGTGTGGDGSGGEEATGGSGGELTPADFAPELDGYLYTGECSGGNASFECPMAGCSGNVFNENAQFDVSGDPGTIYDVTLHVYGVVELRTDYAGGERRQADADNNQSAGDFWYSGGSYTPGAGYNVYELRVTPAVEGVSAAVDGGNNYFLNARDSSNEAHEVWEINTEAVVPVQGGGTIEFTAYDPNCLQIMNNSETTHGSGNGPDGSIVVDLSSASPEATDFAQPLSTDGRTGQWVYIDVLSVAAR